MHRNHIKLVSPITPKEQGVLAEDILLSADTICPNFDRLAWINRIVDTAQSAIRVPSPAEHQAIKKAEDFVTEELARVGFRELPQVLGILTEEFCLSKYASHGAQGIANANLRAMYLQEGLAERDQLTAQSVIAHEFIHLSGEIKLGQNEWVSMGLIMRRNGKLLFSILGEFVTTTIQNKIWKDSGFQESRGEYLLKLVPASRNPSLLLFAAVFGEIYQTPEYK